jgi:hypothetical protein
MGCAPDFTRQLPTGYQKLPMTDIAKPMTDLTKSVKNNIQPYSLYLAVTITCTKN